MDIASKHRVDISKASSPVSGPKSRSIDIKQRLKSISGTNPQENSQITARINSVKNSSVNETRTPKSIFKISNTTPKSSLTIRRPSLAPVNRLGASP